MQVLGTRLVGAPETVGNYGLTLTALDAMGNRAANLLAIQVRVGPRPAPAPTPAPKPPAARALGYSQAVVFNCRTGIEPEHPPVTLFRRMLGTIEWRELGALPTSHSGDFCPAPDAKPMIVDLDDGWNELLAVDRTLTFCDGNPASPLCNGGYALVRGDLRGGLYQWNLPY
jgi:hypothetical protein